MLEIQCQCLVAESAFRAQKPQLHQLAGRIVDEHQQRARRSPTTLGLGWLTTAEFAQTINPRCDVVLRGRNGSHRNPP